MRYYNKIIFVINTILISVFLFACSGTNDWSFELPNNFEVWHINSKDVKIVYCGFQSDVPEIPSFVKEFSFTDRYVCTRNIDNIDSNDIMSEIYYILDTEEKTLYGPYDNITEFEMAADELQFAMPEFWYRTSTDPNAINEKR